MMFDEISWKNTACLLGVNFCRKLQTIWRVSPFLAFGLLQTANEGLGLID
jgi:hypothetical protein